MLRTIGNFVGLSESQMQDQSAGEIFISLLLLPFRLCWGFIVFMVFAWTTSRSGRSFVFALPAMFFAVLFVAIVWAVGFKGDAKAFGLSAGRYSKASDPTEVNYNPDAALLYAKKMVATAPDDDSAVMTKYELGKSYELLEKYDEAFDVMKWLAPDMELDAAPEKLGYTMAYYWLSTYYADKDKSSVPDDQRKALSRKQMELAYLADNTNTYAVLGLAGMNREDADELKKEAESLRENGNDAAAAEKEVESEKVLDRSVEFLEKAITMPLLPETAGRQLYASNVMIDILKQRGQDKDAELKGLQFIARYESWAERIPDFVPFWISIAKVCIQIEDFERAEKFILRGFQLAKTLEARANLFRLLAQVKVEKSKTFTDMDDEQQFLNRLQSLTLAINNDFQVPEGYDEVMYYVDGFQMDSDQDNWLRDSLLGLTTQSNNEDKNVAGGVIHILLGMREILDGRERAGKNHWEIAVKQYRYTAYAINNLIRRYVDSREVSNDIRDNLLAIAIEMFPQEAIIYATRGRYFRDDERFENAIEDLEFANARLQDSIPILEDLVFCYEQVGNSEKVVQLNEKIEDIRAKADQAEFLTAFASSEPSANE